MSKFDLLAERVERLLLRHAELQRTNELLTEQVQTLSQERDLMRSRLNAARNRIDALLERLPQAGTAPATGPTHAAASLEPGQRSEAA
jgi:chromosome segregation ATPase